MLHWDIYDSSTELYYLNARYYDPATSRMLTMDTYRGEKSEPQSLHLYTYTENDPINFIDPSGHKKLNVKAANKYAEKWATKYNSYYVKTKADCTNFVSQIKYAGGIPMKYSENDVKTEGWWYKRKKRKRGWNKVSSEAWRITSSHINYFGVKYSTKSFTKFSEKVKAGSIIAYAYDGKKYNHMAYVTKKTDKYKKTSGVKYKDFKVAQHSRNYHLWVSDKDNGWEKVQKDSGNKAKFAIINADK